MYRLTLLVIDRSLFLLLFRLPCPPLAHSLSHDTARCGAACTCSLIDVQNIAFADRDAYLGDADFAEYPLPLSEMASRQYGALRRDLMRVGRAVAIPVAAGSPLGNNSHPCPADDSNLMKSSTTHFTVADGSGNVVSWTCTIEENMGSGVVVPGRGMLLNNEVRRRVLAAVDGRGGQITGGCACSCPTSTRFPTALGAARSVAC